MSRPWSRFAARTAAVALLSVGVAGGFYLSEDRQSQRSGPGAQVAGSVSDVDVNVEYRQQETVSRQVRTARQQATEVRKQAKAAAEKARKAEEAARKKAEEKAAREAAARAAKPYDGPIPESCEEYSGNRKVGCALMIDAGFKIDQFPCLDRLWNKESGWNHKARNSSSGAYGIPQAYPGNKMSSVGSDWETNPVTQIKWGLGYIKGRYSTPCAAWNHSQAKGYY
ncbi:lytic transglycosylase domain-containing protein [Micromonospora sp. C95]|uniref:aggregation-promoting factor C-terminal-like domain-containing protein n=1 Tax=Micromonospora sp. C95 TaxID=2824882 RepID=UPI001B381D4A|nr:lytic transglycosylase domain-containing protein [Micromonospora sp. C95]MBQ1025957.1 lytic transglycosylase domain-containing protein [Micromonospora sp. C95]